MVDVQPVGIAASAGMPAAQTTIEERCLMSPTRSIHRKPARALALLGAAGAIAVLAVAGSAGDAEAEGILGTQWAENESGWTGRWRRRGRSNVFDAFWTHPRHGQVRAILYMRVTGNVVTITRRDTFGPGVGRGCRYRGVIRGNYVSGSYGCDWARGPFRWAARIYGQSGGGGGGASAVCRNYATAAVNHNRQNIARRCGYRGARWQSNYANHYNWCVRTSQNMRNYEHNQRVAALRRCGAGGGGAIRRFNYPRVNGAILDHCWTWAQNCGAPRAHWFCRSRGYRQAASYGRYRPGRTWVVGSRRFCQGGHCVGYSYINCRR
jgi:hypothetical protein